ncbi:MAG: Signal peptidase-like protein, partial [Cytophagales bacterium]|nr:Signal peptidase-like protein [Cytophagales bacterium]
MGCGSCGSGGCGSKSGGCKTGGCNKLNVFDWLSDMEEPVNQRFNLVEVRFKAGRKEFFNNSLRLDLETGDPVVVESSVGYHVGHVSLQGELVRLQMKKKGVSETELFPSILRIADSKELDKLDQARARELPTLFRTRNIILEQKLNMKLSDVEYQADNTKATFFYSADDRVDFRELIKVLASEFRIRVEMRQINLRQEAGRLGGIGVCGRELCCSTWLTNFKNVATSAARYQNLSLNPVKLSGQCGRLKCCLNYELDTYMEALKDIPEISVPLQTKQGKAYLQKTDIFRRIMWFAYSEESNWHALS